jgi:hypothetical protein
MKIISIAPLAILSLVSQFAKAEDTGSTPQRFDLAFSPVVLDSKNSTGSTVGLDYKLAGTLLRKKFDSVDAGNALNPDVSFGAADISYHGQGTIAASAERNPNNFLELQLDGKLLYSASRIGTISGGLLAKYEADQSFKNKNSVLGLSGTYGKYGALLQNDSIALDANYSRVDPKDDAQRKVALGASPLKEYYRWNLELLYKIPVGWKTITDIELNYRYFKEQNAPDSIKQADIAKHDLITLRVGLKNDLFLAYSSGKLPFDRKNDQAVKIGFSYKLK